MPVQNHNRICDILRKIDKILPQISGHFKRMININFILQKNFEILDLPTDKIKITRTKKTLMYEYYWNKIIKGAAYLHFHTFYEHSALASFKRYTNHLYIKLNCKKYSITLEIEKWQLFNPESTLAPIHPGP